MIFINWYRIDWIFWDWIFIGILILIIFVLRLFRRIYRWKNLELHGIERQKFALINDQIDSVLYINKFRKSNSCIIIFSPLFGSKKAMDSFSCSLAIKYHKVYLVQSKELILNNNKLLFRDLIDKILKLINNDHIQKFIFFDCSALIMKELLSNININFFEPKCVLIRPIYQLNPLKNSLSFKYRVSGGPFLLFWIGLLLSRKKIGKKMEFSADQKKFDFKYNSNNILYILPENLIDKSLERLINVEENKKANRIRIPNGGWSFYKHETMILSIINDFFDAECKLEESI